VTGGDFSFGAQNSRDDSADIRVLIVEDNPLVRVALAERLSDEEDLDVIGLCEDGSQVVEAAARLHPDVVCMDLSMPVMDGLAATEAVRAARMDVRVVLLTASATTPREAGAAGADAVVPKSARPAALLRCIRTLATSGTGCPYCL